MYVFICPCIFVNDFQHDLRSFVGLKISQDAKIIQCSSCLNTFYREKMSTNIRLKLGQNQEVILFILEVTSNKKITCLHR